MIYVTHDQVEAMTLANKIVVLREGRVEQVGSPTTIYDNPNNLFVAGFIGSPGMNFLDAEVVSSKKDTVCIRLPKQNKLTFDLAVTSQPAKGGGYKLGVRPEHFNDNADLFLKLKEERWEHLVNLLGEIRDDINRSQDAAKIPPKSGLLP